jgi:hypothetical protein
MKLTITILALAFAAIQADNIIAGIVAYSYGTASHQGRSYE